MNRRLLSFALAAILLFVTSTCQAAGVEELLKKRSVTLWYDGVVFDDLLIGARAQFEFVYVDSALSQAVIKDVWGPDWLRNNVYFYGSKETKKKALFIVRVGTSKSLTLQLPMIKIGSHTLEPEDVLTNKHYVPVGDLPSGFSADFAVAVPLAAVKGSTRRLSVGEYNVELEFPIR